MAKHIAAVNKEHNERRCPPLCLGAKPSIASQSQSQSDGFAVDTTVPPICVFALLLITAISPQTQFALKLTCYFGRSPGSQRNKSVRLKKLPKKRRRRHHHLPLVGRTPVSLQAESTGRADALVSKLLKAKPPSFLSAPSMSCPFLLPFLPFLPSSPLPYEVIHWKGEAANLLAGWLGGQRGLSHQSTAVPNENRKWFTSLMRLPTARLRSAQPVYSRTVKGKVGKVSGWGCGWGCGWGGWTIESHNWREKKIVMKLI